MAPKKDKSKPASDWMQCSVCGKLISSLDAEAHCQSCDSDHGYIQDGVLHGKVARLDAHFPSAEEKIREKDRVVWLPISAMQFSCLSIGQPCIVNRLQVKQSWPQKSLSSTQVVFSALSQEELSLKENDLVTVERFFPGRAVVKSAVLKMRDVDDVFEKPEFQLFAAAYLDGWYITEGTTLTIKYFGRTAQFCVTHMICETSSVQPGISCKSPITTQHAPERPSVSSPLCSSSHDVNQDSALNLSSSVGDNTTTDLDLSSLSISSLPATPNSSDKKLPTKLSTPNFQYNKIISDLKLSSSSCPFARVSSKCTKFLVLSSASTNENIPQPESITMADIGGLKQQYEELKSIILRAQQSCVSHCVLLYGQSGTGKSSLVKAVTRELGVHTIKVKGTDIWSHLFGQAESNLQKIFTTAKDRSPSIVVFDEMDVLFPKRSHQTEQQEHRIVGTMLTIVDDLPWHEQAVVVIGITNNKDQIDPALRRAGRFECEVEVTVPSPGQRREILEVLLRKYQHNLSPEDIESIARQAHGYVGADFRILIDKAKSLHEVKTQPSGILSLADFKEASDYIKPNALKELQLEVPEVKWTDIGGMAEVKMRLREAVELPLTRPEVFKRLGIEPPRGLLMYGPPGCSKTMVARALATECSLNFLAVKGPEIFSQYVGESEKTMREVFRKARSAAPSIIFFDEIDAIAATRGSCGEGSGVEDRVLTQLLTEMDGLEYLRDVFIIAATNRPDKIDPALLRPGRFDSLVYVPLPDDETRREILDKKLARMPTTADVSLDTLVAATEGYSGAEIVQVCKEAALFCMRENMAAQQLQPHHFDRALHKVFPQIDASMLQLYATFSRHR